jgi:hypothetical protein
MEQKTGQIRKNKTLSKQKKQDMADENSEKKRTGGKGLTLKNIDNLI